MEKEGIDMEEEGDEEPRLKEMGPQLVGSLPASIPTKPVKGVGIRKAKEIEGREEGKKTRAHGGASYDGSELGGMYVVLGCTTREPILRPC